MKALLDILGRRILVLDGAMGTMLQKYGLCGNSESFNLTHPDVILKIHKEYIDAGADIIETNSFSANRISQSEYGCEADVPAMAEAAARIARKAADSSERKVWVAGSIGPTGKSLSLSPDISNPAYRPFSFDDMADAYQQQIAALIRGGVDILLLETCFDALNTKAAIYAISRIPGAADIPVIISASASDRSGRTLTGQTLEAFYRSVQHANLLAFGLNCSLGAKDMAPLIADVSSWAECAVSCYPNAGLPNEMGQYDELPSQTAQAVREIALAGNVNIVGGCCGTTPEHIRCIAQAVKDIRPRKMVAASKCLTVSGLEALAIDKERNNFTNIGERTNVAGSRKFARLIAEGDYDSAMQIAAGQIESGASIIDVNMDDAMLDSTAQMECFLRHISNDPAVAKAAVMVDSSHWETVLAGLKNAQGKCIVNSISLKEGEEVFLQKAREIKALGAAVVVMAFDEEGQATTYDRKIEICARAYRLLTEKLAFNPYDIIFDVNVLAIGTGIAEHSRYGIDYIEAVRWIKQNLPRALTSGGISNLSFSFRGNNVVREAMHSAFLFHAIKAGLDMGIVNPAMLKVYDDVEPELLRCVEDVIFNSDDSATDRLIEKAGKELEASALIKEKGQGALADEGASLPLEERLVQALVRGRGERLREDILECMQKYQRAVDVIEGPLMAGMAKVGELFGAGKMFLPQVVKSAKIMRDAVALLQPYLEQNSGGASKHKVVIATVKGDVHDIGKNITATVLGCNGFEVHDLGVMVPKEELIAKALEINADIICTSGLITPSLFQMEELCRDLAARKMDVPLLIGGATTSALHTAVKLAPLYGHVFYGSDASASAVMATRLMGDRENFEAEEHRKQDEIRAIYESRAAASHKTAETPQPRFPAESYLEGQVFDNIPAMELTVEQLLPFFDWRLFHAIWGIKETERNQQQMLELDRDAHSCIDRLIKENGCRITLAARFDACQASEDIIRCRDYELPMLRQEDGDRLSLCDFVAPAVYGKPSPVGMFAISVHKAHSHGNCNCGHCENDYEPLLERTVRLALAEAASLWLDRHLQEQVPQDIRIIKPAAGYASCPDHSLKRDILLLLPDAGKLEITLTESCAMIPDASICGLIFAHPYAAYPDIHKLSPEAVRLYASLRGMTPHQRDMFLGNKLI